MAPLSSLTTLVDKTTKEVKNPKVRGMAKAIATNPALNEGVMAMMERAPEMRSPLTALLAGIAAEPRARRLWEDSMDDMWAEESKGFVPKKTIYPEVFIGAGMTGAVYCATRVANGQPAPLVLEQGERVGGSFAVSKTPSFYLNSRNRPGGLGIPGSQGALNFLPHAPVQPAELGYEEYQVNTDMAYAIRAAYAHTGAQVVVNQGIYGLAIKETKVKRNGRESRDFHVEVSLRGRGSIKARRVIVGTGIGQPKENWYAGERLLSFAQFMRRLDEPFPLRKMGRVAVIGAGDSGKVVIEALVGQGPARPMTVAALDYPTDIVWFGQTATTRQDFEGCNRSRYRKLGTLFQGRNFRNQRVLPRRDRVESVEPGFDCVLVDGQPFDQVIDCTGFYSSGSIFGIKVDDLFCWLSSNETDQYARYVEDEYGEPRIFFVGPAARLPRSAAEQQAVPDRPNSVEQKELLVAAWRYTGRTAMLAQGM
jgi:hypothetical protein